MNCIGKEINPETQCCLSCGLHQTMSKRYDTQTKSIVDVNESLILREFVINNIKKNSVSYYQISYNMFFCDENEHNKQKTCWIVLLDSLYTLFHQNGVANCHTENVVFETFNSLFVNNPHERDNIRSKFERLQPASQFMVWVLLQQQQQQTTDDEEDNNTHSLFSHVEIVDMRVPYNNLLKECLSSESSNE